MLDLDTLIDRCRQGDDLAWEALVCRCQGRVYAIARHYMGEREEARDTAQEVFIKVYRSLPTLRRDQAFLPWLVRLTRNCCRDRLRRLAVRTPAREVAVDEVHDLAAAPGPSPDAGQLLRHALATLSAKSREVILLKDIQELRLDEIAELLDLPIGTVKSRSHRARLELAAAVRALDAGYGQSPRAAVGEARS